MRAVTFALVLIGCAGAQTIGTESSPPPSETTATTAASPPRERAAASAASATRTEPSEAVAPGPPPGLAVRGTPGRHGRIAIAIENRGTTSTSVARTIGLEVARGETWSAVEGVTLTVRADCQHEAPACQELAPGAALAPPDWLGTMDGGGGGDGQCACERCASAPSGTYRFVARTCDGAHTIAGTPFDL